MACLCSLNQKYITSQNAWGFFMYSSVVLEVRYFEDKCIFDSWWWRGQEWGVSIYLFRAVFKHLGSHLVVAWYRWIDLSQTFSIQGSRSTPDWVNRCVHCPILLSETAISIVSASLSITSLTLLTNPRNIERRMRRFHYSIYCKSIRFWLRKISANYKKESSCGESIF